MSPFAHVDKASAPLLLIHGGEDPNVGTHLIQSERLYAAMSGLGKHVRLVVLPHERHSYDAEESVLHCVWEQDTFLRTHVLGESGAAAASTSTTAATTTAEGADGSASAAGDGGDAKRARM